MQAAQDAEDARAFGMLGPMEQIRVRNLLRRLADGGGPSTVEELEFAKRLPFLRRHLDAWAEQRAFKSPIYKEVKELTEKINPSKKP